MAYLMAGGLAGLAMAVMVLANGGGILAALLAYALCGAAATVLLACVSAMTQTAAPLPPRQIEDRSKRLA